MGTPLYNPNDGLTGRDGGPYLDEVQAVASEELRAKKEGREPDYDNVPADAGIQLSTASQLLRAVDVNRPSKFHETGPEAERMFAAAAESDNDLKVAGEIPDLVFKTELEDNDDDEDSAEYPPVGDFDLDDDVGETPESTPAFSPYDPTTVTSEYAPDGGNLPDAAVVATNDESEGK